jgi:hypothetical protein
MATTPVKVWTKLLGTSGEDTATALTTGLDGSIYVGGYTSGALDGQTYSGRIDAFLTKYSADGTKVWTKLLGSTSWDSATALTTGLDGSIYVSGYTLGDLDGQANSGVWDAFLTKFSTDGTKAWTKLLGSSPDDRATALTTGLDGSIYVSGHTSDYYGGLDGQTNSGGDDAFLIKYSTDGTKAWTRLLGTSRYDYAKALTTGLDGSIYVTGETPGALDGQTNSGVTDAFLTKYSADGTKAWTKLLGTRSYDAAIALTTGLDGSIYASGYAMGSLDGQTYGGSTDAFLTKFSTDGTKVWTKLLGTSGNDLAYALTTGLDGSIYVSGYTNGTLDGQTNSGGNDAFLTKYSTDGTKVWTKLLGTSGDDEGAALTTGLDGSIYVSGWTYGALDGQSNSGSNDAFLTKFQEVGTATYALSAGASSYNEGSTASFTLTTTNVTSGTSVPYTLSGVSAADVSGGSLIGNAVVNSSGVATISATLLNDALTEGAETLTATAGGATVSTVINDTSKSSASPINMADPIYSDYTKHYYQALTNNVSWYSALSLASAQSYKGLQGYLVTITSKTEDDFVNNSVVKPSAITGYSFSSGYKSFWIGASDEYLEGTWIWMSGPESGQTVYQYGGNSNTKYENFWLQVYSAGSANYLYSNVPVENATLFPGNINRIFWDDLWINPIMSGQSGNGFVVEYGGLPATYSITPSSTSVNEDATLIFTVNTTNIEWGTSINYSISGITSADISDGKLSGTTTIFQNGLNGLATVVINIAADKLTEGNETLILNVGSATASAVINDTSGTATYSLSASSVSVDEGSTATFTLITTGVASGTSISYTISGSINPQADTSFGALTVYSNGVSTTISGNAIVNASGVATISVTLLNDNLSEGTETLTITAGGATASTVVNDTSKSTASYALSAGSTIYNEGSIATFTLKTTNLASGTSVPFTLSGISAADISGGALSGNAIVNSSGVATIYVSLLNDNLAEDLETLTVTAGSATASTVINDTSKGTTNYSISAASATVDEGSIAAFTFTASNFTGGGVFIPYTISGINAADVSDGALSGVAFISSNGTSSGTATISIPILADLTTEGAETLSVTAQGKSASMTIIDTSKTAATVPVVTATAAADTITNLPVSQMIDAGAGIDTLVYNSNSYDVLISKSGGSTKVTNTATGEVDTLSNVERLKFADTAIALDTNGVGGQAYRVYQAAFNRTPDLGGLGYWISGMDGGASLKSVAQGFVSSAEFKAVYGSSPTNAQIITKFYENVLHRAPESGGYNYWLGILNSGQGTVADVLAAFSESPENQSGVISVIEKGMRYTPFISPTYSLFASASSVNEGTVASFTLRTTNVAEGTPISYTLSGINAADVFGGTLSGNAVVTSGLAFISVALLNDLLTENAETLKVTAGGATASIVVNDTSITLVGNPGIDYGGGGSDSGGGDSGGGGGGVG